MTAKYAPARESDGLLPYVETTTEWAGKYVHDQIVWAENLKEARAKFGWTRQLHMRISVRRATPDDMPPLEAQS